MTDLMRVSRPVFCIMFSFCLSSLCRGDTERLQNVKSDPRFEI